MAVTVLSRSVGFSSSSCGASLCASSIHNTLCQELNLPPIENHPLVCLKMAPDSFNALFLVLEETKTSRKSLRKPTFTVLSTAPEKRRPLETARAVTLPWCRSSVWVQIMLSMLHTYGDTGGVSRARHAGLEPGDTN